MDSEEIMNNIRQDTPLNKVRAVFSDQAAGMEQAGMQRVMPTPVESRGMEFVAVQRILKKAAEVGLVEINT